MKLLITKISVEVLKFHGAYNNKHIVYCLEWSAKYNTNIAHLVYRICEHEHVYMQPQFEMDITKNQTATQ